MGGIGGLFSQWLPRINQCPGLPDSMKSLFSKRTESAHVSKEFWMHDQSCLACYECESRFTLLKRKHHCRVCGRVFCAKCTSNVVPCPSNDQSTTSEKRVRVCNFCFKEWEQHFAMGNDNASQGSSSYNSVSSSSPLSVVSTRSRGTVPNGSPTFASGSPSAGLGFLYHDQSPDRFRSDNDDGDFGVYASDYQSKQYSRTNGYYGHLAFDERDSDYGLEKVEPDIDIDSKSMDGTSMYGSCDSPGLEEEQKIMEEVVPGGEEVEPPSSDYVAESVDTESVDFENNVVLWFPPEPEDEEDESEASLFDDDDGDVTGEWRHLRTSSSFESEELHSRDRSNKEHKKATKYVVDRHFKALVAQLLQAENVPVGEAGDKESWLKIITSLAFEGAMLLKPDTSKGGVMDTGGYVKIKCLASGRHSDSNVVKGVICTKNVAHRQMVSNLEKPRILILGGALEYQRVSDFLSSFNTLLEQEMDHLKMAVAKIEAHHPDILLVEKSVSRYAQEYLLTKEITLVLNIKRPLLERIARCTGAQIVPSIDHLSSPKLGYCDQFYVKRSLEEHGTAGQDGKKLVKTLMYFEGCPKPLGCTVLLRGANGDELKKVKHVVQYGIFAAYHLALETSFLADEGASLTQLPLDTPITVSLPDKRSSIDSGNDCFEDYARRACADLPSAQVDRKQMLEEPASLKEEFFPSPSDHQSILVSLSSRCLRKGTVCGRSHLFRIKYYSNFDKPLGRYLSDHLFDQNYRCHFCEMPSDAHDQCYTHRQGTLTISVKKLPEIMLHGEEDSKIWMWHRCLRCPRINGVPPATRRIVMSDAAWGLSFGKFLDLSFSNHAAASRAASCGHSLHRDCLRFYGLLLPRAFHRFGKMVACFRYASIDVHSVHLPPTKLEFNYENQDWIQKKLNQVVVKAATMFSDVVNSLRTLAEKQSGRGQLPNSVKVPEARCQIASLEIMLQNEKMDFEKLVENIQTKETKEAEPVLDILEINRLGRQLLFQSYMWDHRLQYVASLDKKASRDDIDFISPESAKISLSNNKLSDPHTVAGPVNNLSGRDTVPVDAEGDETNYQSEKGNNTNHQEMLHGSNWTGKSLSNPSGVSTMAESDPLDKDINVLRTLPDGQCPREANLSESLDAESTGKNHAPAGIVKDDISPHSMNAERDSSTAVGTSGKLAAEDKATELTGSKVFQLPSLKIYDQTEDTMSWLRMPFVSFYRSFTKSLPVNVQKMENYNGYNPVYISTFREPESQVGSRGMFPVGLNGIVVPVFDDEPTSIISHALLSPDYVVQLSDDTERSKDAIESMGSRQIDPGNLQVSQSADEAVLQSYRSPVRDESFISTGPRNFAITELHSYNKILHAKVTFDHPLGEVKYKVTCYYARRFEALRKICCPSKVDFVRSLSRCKQWGAKGGKSNVFFAKTLDDRFIIKQVTKTELESFLTLAPEYFKHLSESIDSGSQTCLAKILGIYQVTTKNAKGGKNLQMDLLVMENLLFGRNLTRLYDLKGSTRARYNPDPGGSNKVLLDQNLIEAMPTSPIFLGNEAKRLLERAVWNDTAFLASVDVMDYSLLVGVDEEKHELVLGIIDFMRQYTWDKHLETYVKASGILGGPKNASPTVISPQQYKKRFRKAMTTYFPVVPDEWSRPTIIPSKSQASQAEDNIRCGINSIE